MGNCLKTQLKENVNNGNLDKIGMFRIRVHSSELYDINQYTIVLPQGTEVETVDGSLKLTLDKNNVDRYSKVTVGTNGILYFDNGNYDVLVSGKYTVDTISQSSTVQLVKFSMNIDDLYICNKQNNLIKFYNHSPYTIGDISNILNTNINYIDIANTNILGNTESFYLANLSNLRYLALSSGISGGIDKLCNLYTVNALYLGITQIDGRIEDFASMAIEKGASTEHVAIQCNGIMTVDNNIVPRGYYAIVTFNSSSTPQYSITIEQ